MYAQEEALRPAVRWEKRGQALHSFLAGQLGVGLETRVTIDDDGITCFID
jgi:hypothetical protein